MRVYVIEKGVYSDRHVIGVTDDRKTAKKLCDMLDASYSIWDTDQYKTKNSIRFQVYNPDNNYTNDTWYAEYDEYDLYREYKENAKLYDGVYIIYADSPQQAIEIAQRMEQGEYNERDL